MWLGEAMCDIFGAHEQFFIFYLLAVRGGAQIETMPIWGLTFQVTTPSRSKTFDPLSYKGVSSYP